MSKSILKGYVATVIAGAALAVSTLPTAAPLSDPAALAVLAALSMIAGWNPIRFRGHGAEATPTHPMILCALAGMGAHPALLVAVVGVFAAVFLRRKRALPIRTLFNLASVVASTAVAAHLFYASGGVAGVWEKMLPWPLVIATSGYFLMNTGLVAAAITIERAKAFSKVWRKNFRWTAASYFSGLTLALGMLVALEKFGVAGLAIGLPAVWLLTGFYSAHYARHKERSDRVVEVEALNNELQQRVFELQSALSEVRELRGLLPICMHCKSIRDDDDSWHQVEAYVAKHSDASFTHSCCDNCRTEHYDLPARETAQKQER